MADNSTEDLKKQLWGAANVLRKNIDAAEYKHVVLGLVFLRYISDSFEKLHRDLEDDAEADAEDKDEYLAENIFFVPPSARWSFLQSHAKQATIGKTIDESMAAIERENKALHGVLPKVYARDNIGHDSLGALIDLFSNIDFEGPKQRSTDILGSVFEYFLGEFALAEGKKGGQFYTPRSIVELLVRMLQPYRGRIFDPCCGTGGMFVQSEKFITAHQGNIDHVSICGQESNQTTWRLAKMNLAIRRIDSSQVVHNNEGSFLKNAHKELRADFIIANPPFNDSDWGAAAMHGDARWAYGMPPAGNANYAWIQHFLYHLNPQGGMAGFVLSKGALTTQVAGEGEIRKKIIEAHLVDCIVTLPAKLFLNTQIPASLWFLRRGKTYRQNEILFIDGGDLGHLISRKTRELSDDDIERIANTYHAWKDAQDGYRDVAGFCKSVPLSEVAALDFVLTPSRFVGTAEVQDDVDFKERFTALSAELHAQIKEEATLNSRIQRNLAKISL